MYENAVDLFIPLSWTVFGASLFIIFISILEIFTPEAWLVYYSVTSTVFIIYFVIIVVKMLLKKGDSDNRPTEEKCRRDVTSGLTMIVWLYRIPMVVVSIVGFDSLIFAYTFYVSLISTLLILFMFVIPRVQVCHLRNIYGAYDRNIENSVKLHFWLSMIPAAILKVTALKRYDTPVIWISYLLFGTISAPFASLNKVSEEDEFRMLDEVLEENREAEEKKEQARVKEAMEELESSDEEESDDARLTDLDCHICLHRFSAKTKKRTPRMLSCGHTICQECVNSLLKSVGDKYIPCPFFCYDGTFVDGAAKNLPKNYALIGVLEETKKFELAPKNVETMRDADS